MQRTTSLLVVLFATAPAVAAPNHPSAAPAVKADATSGDSPPISAEEERLRAVNAAESTLDDAALTKDVRPAAEAVPATVPAPVPAQPTKTVAALEPTAGGELRDAPTTPALHPQLPRRTPRFDLSGGAFLQSRGLDFDYDPYADGAPPAYESNLHGFAVAAAVYPMPINEVDGRLSGIGFSLKLATSIGSTLVAEDETGVGEYTVQHATYDAAVHYRYPVDKFAIDGEVAYGNWHHTIIDLPESIAVPDTSYQYLSLGAHGEVYPTERASIGATVKYVHVASSGDVMSEDWYGSGQSHGWILGSDIVIPLGMDLSVRGSVEWRRFTLDLQGSGELSDWWGVGTIRDTSLTGSASLGVQF